MSKQLIIGMIFVSIAAAAARGQTVFYVDCGADQTPHDGSDWAHAFVTLQEALAAVDGSTVIRVASGTYLPTSPDGSRYESFRLVSGVTLEGGYAGFGESDPDARDIALYETILSGDIGVPGEATDNSYNVVTCGNADATAVLDGFTITGGYAHRRRVGRAPALTEDASDAEADGAAPGSGGGGMSNGSGCPKLIDCIFRDNFGVFGGGMVNTGGAPTLIDCTFEANTAAVRGGGMSNEHGAPRLVGCRFVNNSTIGAGSYYEQGGGGMANYRGDAMLTDCEFIENSATLGGGVSVLEGAAVMNHCAFDGNVVDRGWGGAVCAMYADVELNACELRNNSGAYDGGGLYNVGGAAALANCVLAYNWCYHNGGGICGYSGPTSLVNCTLYANAAFSAGAAIFAESAPVELVNSIVNGRAPEWAALIDGGENLAVSYSCIGGDWPGEGNIDGGPWFVDASSVYGFLTNDDCDLHLRSGSPCIDAGSNDAVAQGELADLDGNYRFFDATETADTGLGVAPIVDMGAYEFGSTAPPVWGDLNCDGVADPFDIDPFVVALVDSEGYAAAYPHCNVGLADCNGDGAVNAFDIDTFVAIIIGE